MRLEDYLDTIGVDFELRRYPNQGNRWCAQFENCEVKEGIGRLSAHGNGDSPAAAIADYIRDQ